MSITATRPGETILLVKNELPIRRALEGKGYQVIEAPNAEHAMVVAERHFSEIDLLVTDVTLPDINGGDLAYCLGAIMKVLFITGHAEEHAGVRTGVRGPRVLLKPFSADELLRSVRRVLDPRPLAA